MTTPDPDGRLPRRTLVNYGSSAIGINAMTTMVAVHLLFFYTDVVRLAPWVVGLVMALAQVWDAITDPIIGYLSDRTKWRWGRRRPYILLGSVPAAVFFFAVFCPPKGLSASAAGIFFGVTFLLFFAFRTVWDTPYCALAPELSLDYDERTRISAYQQVFGTLGDVIGTMAPVVLVGVAVTWIGIGGGLRSDYAAVGALVAVLAVGSALWTYRGVRENPRLSKKATLPLLKSLRMTFRNRPYVILVAASTCAAMSAYTTMAVVRHVVAHWFPDQDLEAWFFGAFFAGVFLSIPVWTRLTIRIGKKAALIGAMAAYSVLLWSALLLQPGWYVPFAVLMFLAGVFNIALWLIPASIVPDVIEWDQLETGERREGAYYGIWTLVKKAGIGGAYVIIAVLLELSGYEAGAALSHGQALVLRLLLGAIPSVLLVTGLVLFLRFPITKDLHQDIVRRIVERQGKS